MNKAYSMTALDLYNKVHRAYGATAYEPSTLRKHIKYLHACAGYPTKRTWMKAIDNDFYMTWPNLTSALVNN